MITLAICYIAFTIHYLAWNAIFGITSLFDNILLWGRLLKNLLILAYAFAEFTKWLMSSQSGIVSKLFLICLEQVLSHASNVFFISTFILTLNLTFKAYYYPVIECRQNNQCKIWSWCKIRSCGINGSEPPHIWSAWGQWAVRIVKSYWHAVIGRPVAAIITCWDLVFYGMKLLGSEVYHVKLSEC